MEDNSNVKIKGGGILPLVMYVIGTIILLVIIKAFIG
jgi:hypothetical protein